MDKKASALALAARGFRIFPCKPDAKEPAFSGWQEAATTDADLIAAWWSGMYRDANIGVATGKGLLVLDFDTKNGKQGLKSLDQLKLPWGYRVQTPSGGIHVYLAVPEDCGLTVSVDAYPDYPGMDVRCDGGLVIGAGSTINGESYVELGP
jgi:hypothetical protein